MPYASLLTLFLSPVEFHHLLGYSYIATAIHLYAAVHLHSVFASDYLGTIIYHRVH